MNDKIDALRESNSEKVVDVAGTELPVHCPMPGTTLWNSHPRVYLPLKEKGEARCPYCGTLYRLKDQ